MDKQTFFWLLVAVFVAAFIVGPIRQLRSGVVNYRKRHWGDSERRFLRRNDPEKFYLHVAVEITSLLLLLGLSYWVIFRTNAPP
jgi:hypothetical protein